MIVLDSSAVISLLQGRKEGERIKENIANEAVGISAISVHEIMLGARGQEARQFDEFLNAVHVLPFDVEVARKSVAVEQALARKGKPIGKLDTFIAATCITHNLPLLARDKDFKNVDGLRVLLVE
jgi:tRNA(fMet)-specific endonuclease VapC